MRTRAIYALLAVMLAVFAATAAWPQGITFTIKGVITDGSKPLAGAKLELKYVDTGRTFSAKTGKDGSYILIGMTRGNYEISVIGANGQKLFEQKRTLSSEGGDVQEMNLDVSKGGATKEQIEAVKAQNAKAESANALISQVRAAQEAKNYQAEVPLLQQLMAMDPSDYEYPLNLGNAQFSLGQYEDAVQSYDKGIQLAQNTKPDSKKPYTDPAKVKLAISQMLGNQGNAYLKLSKTTEAIAAFTKAAEVAPNPGVAYFNLCATQYNTGNTDGAIQACDKAIAADPNRADSYFIKGSLMFGLGKEGADKKYTAPEGTSETLNKYLELAPDGPHANDAKAMLQAIGAKIETTYKAGKGKKKK